MSNIAAELNRLDVHAWSEVFREFAALEPGLWRVWRDALENSIADMGARSPADAYRRRLTEAMLAVCELHPGLADRLSSRT